jgi:ubiquinone/menaquinone biosynthesis C-methylase UbiE
VDTVSLVTKTIEERLERDFSSHFQNPQGGRSRPPFFIEFSGLSFGIDSETIRRMGFYSDSFFPRIYDWAMKHGHIEKHRDELLAHAHGSVLEIGIGTGLNLDHYPSSIREISAIDPNPGMENELRKKTRHHRIHVDFHRTGAEQLPFPDQSFETVVSTLTLCSIPDLSQALGEIKRVLKPGGEFLFFDHGLSPDPSTAKWQKGFNPVQKVIGSGCQLTRNIESELKEAGFQITRLRNFYLEQAPRIMGYIYEGSATVEKSAAAGES